MNAEFITFVLAPIGYAGLTITAVLSARGRLPTALWRAVTIVIMTHVVLVWAVRYEWRLSEATRNGYAGFVLFHGALLAIIASTVLREQLARSLIIVAFGIVTLGAVPAVFRYEVVELYRIPVVLCALAGSAALLDGYRISLRRRRVPS